MSSSVTVTGSNPAFMATATGKTYAASVLFGSVTSFTNPPAYASGTLVAVNRFDNTLGVDSDSVNTETGTNNRRINVYSSFAEVLWVTISPASGYTIDSVTLTNVDVGEAGGLLDASGHDLTFTPSADGQDLTFTPPVNANIFGVYQANKVSGASAPGIKLSGFDITLSATAAPLPSAVWGGAVLVGLLGVRVRRRGRVCIG
ncbi:MAG TPA: hypothetical protein VH253_19800 [Phycisphaerae bacterium]|nr:hypothetical protein [Phycisphaerae bacterium]